MIIIINMKKKKNIELENFIQFVYNLQSLSQIAHSNAENLSINVSVMRWDDFICDETNWARSIYFSIKMSADNKRLGLCVADGLK